MTKTPLLAALLFALVGCGGSSGGTAADPSADFRATVHTAYKAIPSTVVETPTYHPGLAVRSWAKFRNTVAAAPAPDALVSAKQQILRDVGTLIGHLHATVSPIDYEAVGAAMDQAAADCAAIRGDVAGL